MVLHKPPEYLTTLISDSDADNIRSFTRLNPLKMSGPDGVPGHILKTSEDQMFGFFTDVFDFMTIQYFVVPTWFKILLLKKSKQSCLNDY